MEEGKAVAHQQLLLQRQQQQQLFLLRQFQQQKQQQQQAISRFPSNIDAHLRPHRPISHHHQHQAQQQQSSYPNPDPDPNPSSKATPSYPLTNQQNANSSNSQHQPHPPTKANRPPAPNQAELQMAYQDAWRVCHPDFKRYFSSLEDACERLLPYHVVADYEAEEDDRILDSDTTGQVVSRSQQWDHNIAAKVAEFTATFEKQVLAFNIISRKRAHGEFRSEERLMIEQALLQEERRALLEARTEAGREAHAQAQTHARAASNLRMASAIAHHAQLARSESQAHRASEMIACAPIRGSALSGPNHGAIIVSSIGHHDMMTEEQQEQEQEDGNPDDDAMNGWGSNKGPRDEREPSEDDFLNDEETENGDAAATQIEWRGGGEFDLNTR